MVVLAYILVTLKSGAERDVCKKISSFEEVIQVGEKPDLGVGRVVSLLSYLVL